MTEVKNLDTEEQRLRDAVVDAAIEVSYSVILGNTKFPELDRALEALRAYRSRQSLAVSVCEPPEEHRHHEWHWLEHTSSFEPWRRRMDGTWFRGDIDAPLLSSADMACAGWRYLGPAIPSAGKVEPTDEAIDQLWRDVISEGRPRTDKFRAAVRKAMILFKSPTPRRISDEEIAAEIAHQFGDMDNRTSREAAHKAVRAIIQKVTG